MQAETCVPLGFQKSGIPQRPFVDISDEGTCKTAHKPMPHKGFRRYPLGGYLAAPTLKSGVGVHHGSQCGRFGRLLSRPYVEVMPVWAQTAYRRAFGRLLSRPYVEVMPPSSVGSEISALWAAT